MSRERIEDAAPGEDTQPGKHALSDAAAGRTGVCAPLGFSAGAAAAGIRGEATPERLDIAVVYSAHPAATAGVFTRNRVRAAPVTISALALRSGHGRAVVLNAGNANACTGAQGFRDALVMCSTTADVCDLDPADVFVCSTGVIGRHLAMDRVTAGIRAAAAARSPEGGATAARAIMTTDTVPKTAVQRFTHQGTEYTVGGMAKGAGMLHPDMATLLAVVTTDAPVEPEVLQPLLRRVTDLTLNTITVDGDTSTNDTLLLLANGAAGGSTLGEGGEGAVRLEEAVLAVCDSLAEQLVADAEGATRHFRVEVRGAQDTQQARLAARTVAGSPLVKTAIHGCDPNWGRIVAAVGRSGAEFTLDRVDVTIGDVLVFERGAPVGADLERIRTVFGQARIDITVNLGAGGATGHAWGCDLSPDYVHINADYTT